jgi:glutamyl/glutaminyl-tRNA synthetase
MDWIVKSLSVFDTNKLKWVNSQHLKKHRIKEVLTALVLSPFCVCDYVLLHPTYPLSLRRN